MNGEGFIVTQLLHKMPQDHNTVTIPMKITTIFISKHVLLPQNHLSKSSHQLIHYQGMMV